MSWPASIPSGQVIDAPMAAMDIFPTFVRAAGGEVGAYAVDGIDLMPVIAAGAPLPERDLFWEMDGQTAMRRGPWKLVLEGQLVEQEPPADPVWLSHLAQDGGECTNLSRQQAQLTEELSAAARTWRTALERRWEIEWLPHHAGLTGKVA